MAIVITGAAGFIEYHVSNALLGLGEEVIGIDNLNDYYDPSLKNKRIEQLSHHKNFKFKREYLNDPDYLFQSL
jgi:UDP-glucuronate 4-epimerase